MPSCYPIIGTAQQHSLGISLWAAYSTVIYWNTLTTSHGWSPSISLKAVDMIYQ